MNKQFILKLIAALSIILLAAGCNAKETDNNQAKDEQKEASVQKDEKKEKKTELSAEEIFSKAREDLLGWPGISGRFYSDRVVEGSGVFDIKEKYDAEFKLKTKGPYAFQIAGSTTTNNEETLLNSYYKDKVLYMEVPDEGWMLVKDKGPGPSLKSIMQENPADLINTYYVIIRNLERSGVSHKYIKKIEKDSKYVISLNLDKKAIEVVKDQIYEILNSSLDGQIKDVDTLFENIEFRKLTIDFIIDKKGLSFEKMSGQMVYSIIQGNIPVESSETLDEIKAFTDDITVPVKIKKNAFEITKQEFIEAQEEQ